MTFLCSHAAGQKIRLLQEYLVRPVLENVIVDRSSSDLRPRYLIYASELVTYPEQRSRSLDQAQFYLNRSHTDLVAVTTQNRRPKAGGPKDRFSWSNWPLYVLAERWDYASYCRAQGPVLQFFNPQRRLAREVELPRTVGSVDLPPMGVFDYRGRHFLFYRPLAEPDRKKGYPDLFLFLGDGLKLWEIQLPLVRVETIGIANSGRYLVAGGWLNPDSLDSSPQVTLFMDSTAQTLTTFPFGFTHFHFDRQDRYLLLGDQYRLSLIFIPRRQLLFSHVLGEENCIITDCRFFGDKVIIAMGRKGYLRERLIYNDPQLLLFNLNGDKLDTMAFPLDYTFHGQIIIADDDEKFGLVLQDRLAVFTVHQY